MSFLFLHSDKPKLKLKILDDNIDLINMEENQTLRMECEAKANPDITQIQWTHNVSINKP